MNKYPLLIEIGCEDLPPEMLSDIRTAASANLGKILAEKRFEYSKIKVFMTPRRIAVTVSEVSSAQESIVEQVKGPPLAVAENEGKPTKAGSGFAKKMGVSYEQLKKEKTSKGEYLCCVKEIKGEKLKDLLKDILEEFLGSFSFPVTMRWPGCGIPFPRPIRWLLVKLGKRSVSLNIGRLDSSRSSRGHQIFADKKVLIENIDDYEKTLEHHYVIADPDKRKKYLNAAIDRALRYVSGNPVKPEGLLEEINSSIEYPTGIKGKFPEKYLRLPREVIEACLVHHQRYFPVEDKDGKILNYFVGIRDGISEYLDPIREGYERVLIARLKDAEFFLNHDRAKKLEEYVPDLDGIEFTRGLGTLLQKVTRNIDLTDKICRKLGKEKGFINTAKRIAELGKADLVTGMVGEFPELEGRIGRTYAKMDKEDKKVCEGIYQHYQPRTYEDSVPKLDEAAIVGVSDRIDTLVGNFGRGVQATGSQDPFGMRRACRGLIRILVDKKIALDIREIVVLSRKIYNKQSENIDGKEKGIFLDEDIDRLMEFVSLQIKNYLEEIYTHDIVRCVMNSEELNPFIQYRKAGSVEKIKKSKGFDSLITAFRRINNILKQASDKKIRVPKQYDIRKLNEKAEKELSSLFHKTSGDVEKRISENDFAGVLKILASLRNNVDKYFDEVLVMDPDRKIMENRLSMLKNIVELFSPVGDISELEVR